MDEKCEKHRNRLKLRKKTTVQTTREKNESNSRNQKVSSEEEMMQSNQKIMRSEEMQSLVPSTPNHQISERNDVSSILQEPILSNPDTIFISDEELPTPVKPQQPIPSQTEMLSSSKSHRNQFFQIQIQTGSKQSNDIGTS